MAKGTIKWFNSQKRYGRIQIAPGREIFVHINQWKGPSGSQPQEGQQVTFHIGSFRGEEEAKDVRPVDLDHYRFLNPYNFVRYLDKPTPEPTADSPEQLLMWRCPPPPHDRYVGLTGRITCTVEAVTPLFISDSHAIDEDKEGHKSYRFFQYDGKPALPASSLRGMVRSVFEAVTNSCFAVFDGQRLSYRLEAGRSSALVPARVEKHKDGTWHLRLLTGFAPLNPGRRPKALYAATVHLYDPIQGKRTRMPKVNLDGLEHGKLCYALVEKKGIFTYVIELGSTREELAQPKKRSQYIVSGWLCINNQNVENKRKERFFFRIQENTVGPICIPLPPHACKAYEDLIADYQARHKDTVRARREARQPNDKPVVGKGHDEEPALSRYMYSEADLSLGDGTLVYAGLSGTLRQLQVEYIAPAAVPRVSYDHSIADLLQSYSHLLSCKEYRSLCPACRVFGWVHKEAAKLDKKERGACAGRVRFSHAKLTKDKGVLEKITLAILSTPKPTTTRFYLRPKSGKPRNGLSDAEAGYDGNNVLRGRKVYRHHTEADPVEYERATVPGYDGKDDQNRTVCDVRKPGNKFRFTIDFHNLAPVELGALLWTLELRESDRQGYHRLGLAKPLGFGSIELKVVALDVMVPSERYRSLETDGGWQSSLDKKTSLINSFRQAMEDLYGKPLVNLPNTSDLLALLGEPPDLPIHYPRVDREPSPEGKNFEWFVGNKRSGRDAGPRLTLPLADEDTEGLPILDKYGRVRNS
jgi:CRISPR-associated protein (TIGR03986 family)